MTSAQAFAAGAVLGAAAAGLAAWAFLRERSALFGRLFSFAMHELNTPVTAVNMTVINLLTGVFGEIPPSQRPWLEMTREQVGRLNALAGEIRDLVHFHLHRDLRATVGPADPRELVDQAVVSIRRGMEQAGVELTLEVEDGLPPVRTDEERAARSLASLLFHARKFRVGGPVRLSVRRAGAEVEFRVDYDGTKLSPAEARRCLELFYPARKRKDQLLAATGLGLGLVREVMETLGGSLSFEVDGRGASRLSLRVPAEAA